MFKNFFLFSLIVLFLSGCQTIKEKSDKIVKKENEKFGQFIGMQAEDLKNEIGMPTEDFVNDLGNEILLYKTKKYGLPCERKFEVNSSGTIISFSTSGCI